MSCQICGRPIRTVRGLIAAHGYRCPWLKYGDGHRTRPCFGSGHLPYEQSCVALDAYIPMMEAWHAQAVSFFRTFHEVPPDSLDFIRTDAYGKVLAKIVRERPADFDRFGPLSIGIAGSYGNLYKRRHRELESEADHLRATLTVLRHRRQDWKEAA